MLAPCYFFSAPQVARTQCERVLPDSPTFNSVEITKKDNNPLAMASEFPEATLLHLLFRQSKIVGITQGRINSSVQAINLLLSKEDTENTNTTTCGGSEPVKHPNLEPDFDASYCEPGSLM